MKEKFYQIPNPNVFPWQRFFETDRAGYLVRQYFRYNLSDRIGSASSSFLFLYPIPVT